MKLKENAALIVGIALGLALAAGAAADSVGTLQVSRALITTRFGDAVCPTGTPATTSCYRNVGGGVVAGLGKVTTAYTLVYDDFGSVCAHVHAEIPIVVAGKGEIDLAMRSPGCITSDDPGHFPATVTVSGGSGLYANAAGSGALETYSTHGAGGGTGANTWTGNLDVAGLRFDTTPPRIAGATSKTVTTRASAGARVRYSVHAVDATDGLVPAACLPKSGGVFRVGRTTVRCTAIDGSGNRATAHFVIGVMRVR
jgi:hypothetical protein